MDWIHSYKSVRDHPKTRKLARRVGDVPRAVGLLHCLWWWSVDYARDGDLSKYSPEDIAVAAEWDDDPDELIRHLTECGYLLDAAGKLVINDHWEHIGRYIADAETRAEAMRNRRASKDRDVTVPARYKHVTGTLPSRPSRAKREREIERKKRAGAHESAPPPAVSSVDNSAERVCWRCGHVISGDEVLDDLCVISSRGIRHRECAA